LAARTLIAALGLLLTHAVPTHAGVDRPPQFIVMAFDNCTELERWQELTDFAAEMNRDGDRIHFTFFVSGINFIADAKRNIYEGPHQRRGYSRISFGGAPDEVRRRVDYVNDLYRNGHEIASHAVGHFNGAAWSSADWDKEFRAFGDMQTYLHYFKTNYAGNRAPLHIGHHFTGYQGGAYNEALKSFARAVCGLPEVRCVTYARLADFMDQQNADTLAAYRRGDFARAATPALNVAEAAR
jgi:hypothetical protein